MTQISLPSSRRTLRATTGPLQLCVLWVSLSGSSSPPASPKPLHCEASPSAETLGRCPACSCPPHLVTLQRLLLTLGRCWTPPNDLRGPSLSGPASRPSLAFHSPSAHPSFLPARRGLWNLRTCVRIPPPCLIGCVAFGKSLNISGLPFPHL